MNASFRSCLVVLALTSASLVAADSNSTVDRPAQAVTTVAPTYPYLMRHSGAAAEITVSFNVNAKGVVTGAKVVDSTNPEFIAATLEALKKWSFTPAIKEGKPVESRVVQTFVFNVRRDSEAAGAAPVATAKRKR